MQETNARESVTYKASDDKRKRKKEGGWGAKPNHLLIERETVE